MLRRVTMQSQVVKDRTMCVVNLSVMLNEAKPQGRNRLKAEHRHRQEMKSWAAEDVASA